MSGLSLDAVVFGRQAFRSAPLTLQVPAGATVALIGPNGSGKTTLLKSLAGLIPPLAGRIDGIGRAAYLPPPGEIEASYPALHIVALGRAGGRGLSPTLSPGDYDAASAAMERLGVAALAERPFDRLSTGQRQLVLIARLLVQSADLCLFDEPTAALDPINAAAVRGALRDLAAEGRTVVFSTHDLGEVAKADLGVALGEGGVVVCSGAGRDVIDPQTVAAVYGSELDLCSVCGRPHP